MKNLKTVVPTLFAWLILWAWWAYVWAETMNMPSSNNDEMVTRMDQEVKNFTLPALMGDNTEKDINLSDYYWEDKWTLLFFYPKDWTTVCPTELRALLDEKEKFDEIWVEILPISVDSIASHKEWKPNLTEENFDFTWISDKWWKLSKYLGIYDYVNEVSYRWVFLINPEWKLRWSVVYNNDIARDMTEITRMIEQTQTVRENGWVCPFDWKTWDDTIEEIPEYEIKTEDK